jgi:nucleoside-diphosphate-sugar epimerase
VKVAVTGAFGFIGSHLLPVLISAGHEVAASVEPGTGSWVVGVRTFPANVTTSEGLAEGFSGVNAVVHLAARNHVIKEADKDPLSAYRLVNVEGTVNVFRSAYRAGAGLMIHLSSVKAMGEGSDYMMDENTPCAPRTAYGISKLESEGALKALAAESKMRVVILRLPMVYGPRNKGNLPRMIRWANRGLPFPLFQPDNLRSMIYVENVVAGVLASIKKAPEGISTYILKDREDYSTRTVYSAICRELGIPPCLFPVPATLVRLGGMLSGDFRKVTGSFRVSSGKIEKELGFSPPVSLEEGIARTVAWYKRSAH